MINFLTESNQLTTTVKSGRNSLDFAIALFLILTVVTYCWVSTMKHIAELKANKLERTQREAATVNVKNGIDS